MACDDLQANVTEKSKTLVARLTEKTTALANETREKAKSIDPQIDTTGPDAWVSIDFKVDWERVDFSLDLPEVTIKDQKWSLDLPQVTIKNEDIIFHTPSVRMKTVKTGEYPETIVTMVTKDIGLGVKIDVPETTVRWSPIYIDLPEPFLQEQRIVIGIPQFKMERVDMVLGIPEFTMKRHSFAMHLPQFTVKDIKAEAAEAGEKGRALSAETKMKAEKLRAGFQENAKLELGHDVTALFDCYQKEIMTQKNHATQQFDNGINLLQGTITSMVANKVPEENESLRSMRASLTELTTKRDVFFKDISERLISLGKQQESFFQRLIS